MPNDRFWLKSESLRLAPPVQSALPDPRDQLRILFRDGQPFPVGCCWVKVAAVRAAARRANLEAAVRSSCCNPSRRAIPASSSCFPAANEACVLTPAPSAPDVLGIWQTLPEAAGEYCGHPTLEARQVPSDDRPRRRYHDTNSCCAYVPLTLACLQANDPGGDHVGAFHPGVPIVLGDRIECLTGRSVVVRGATTR